MRKIATITLFATFLFSNNKGSSQTVRTPISAGYLGLGAYSNTHIDVFSFHANQAALAKATNISIGFYGEKRFFLNELSLYNGVAVLPSNSGNFGLDARYYGFADYNETQLGLAYARGLGSKLDVGVQFNYYSVRVAGYGSVSTINFEAGAILHLTDQLNAGVHVYNPVGGTLGKNAEEEKLASLYSVGLGYQPSDKVFVSAEVEKQEDQPVNVKAGIQYKFLRQLTARGGVETATSSMYFGIGFGWKLIRIHAVASYHPQLGITPGLVLIFDVKKDS